MATSPPSSSPPCGAFKGASPPSVCKVFLVLARPTAPLFSWCWSPPSSVSLLSSPLNLTSRLLLLPRPLANSYWPTVFPSSLLLMFSPSTVRSSSKMCLILTHGSLLRDLCRDYPQIRTFLEACRLAINDESQQGGHAGFTILATCLARACLQIVTGDREQTRAGTEGDQLRESLLKRLAHKGIGFLGEPPPRLPSEIIASFASVSLFLRPLACKFSPPPVILRLFLLPKGWCPQLVSSSISSYLTRCAVRRTLISHK